MQGDKWDYLKNPSPKYESLERLEGKTKEAPFFKVQSGRITACLVSLLGIAQNAQRPPL